MGWQFRPLLVACTALCVATPALAQTPISPAFTVDRWGVDEGLANNALTHILQTRDGYLWVASWAGIVRFDGVRFTPVADNLPNVHVLTLLEDRDGAVWIGTVGGGVMRWRPQGSEVFTTAEGLAGNSINTIVQDRHGRLWVATDKGLSRIELSASRSVTRITNWPNGHRLREPILGLAARDGQIWIGLRGAVCAMRDSDEPACLPVRSEIAARPDITLTIPMLADGTGRVWVGTTGAGLVEMTNTARDGTCASGCFAGTDVMALAEARAGGIWIGFGGTGGVALLRDGAMTRYTSADDLPAFPVTAIFEDAEGSVWIATDNGGLARLRPKRVKTYSVKEGLPARAVGSIAQDTSGSIWAGTRCGPVARLVDDRFEPQFVQQMKDACALSVLAARDGSVWIGTERAGVFRWDGTRLRHFGRDDGLAGIYVPALFEDRRGVVWISTNTSLQMFAGDRLSRPFGAQDGLAPGAMVAMAEDARGRLWIGSNANGLYVHENGRFRAADVALPTGHVAALMVDSRDDLWIGTAERGLFRLRGNRLDAFGPAQGLGDKLVALMLEDRDGNLWVSTTRGIARLERSRVEAVAEGRERSLDPIVVDRTDGLLNTEGMGGGFDPSGLGARDGRLWFSTIDGIAVVDPAAFRINTIPPRMVIEGGLTDGRVPARDGDDRVQVPAGTEAIELAYTAFSLLVPPKVRFRYRLHGADSNWHDAGARRTAYYGRLAPGEYTFEVVAANNDGVWSAAPATERLVVAPFWWERRQVQGAALLMLLAATGAGAHRLAHRRARRRLEDLERERALDRERSRIARDLHDDLGSRLAQIALIAEDHRDSAASDRISGVAREAMQTMDELVWTVNARNDTVESLAEYAAEFAEEHLTLAGLRYRLQIQPDLRGRELSADARRHLFLAYKEALHNIVKHAGATDVRVALRMEGPTLVLEVSDNGRGISSSAATGTGNGLRNMRERMHATGGALHVETPAEGGTRLVFRTPT